MAVINGIKAKQRGEEADIGLGKYFAGQVAVLRQVLFPAVEGVEKFDDGLVISLLCGGKAGAVDSVIDRAVDSVDELVDAGAKVDRA